MNLGVSIGGQCDSRHIHGPIRQLATAGKRCTFTSSSKLVYLTVTIDVALFPRRLQCNLNAIHGQAIGGSDSRDIKSLNVQLRKN